MAAELGLRERKKLQTRQLIFETATRLFAERGFEAVTVADVARAADVSDVTVFNYFPTKEDLFFEGMQAFEERLIEGVRHRAPGESAPAAFRRVLLESSSRLGDEKNHAVIVRAATLIGSSPALRAREREVVARYTEQLAIVLAEETSARRDDVEPWSVAGALMGAHRALVENVRRRVLEGRRGAQLEAEARSQIKRAFAPLERGLAGYAVKVDRG